MDANMMEAANSNHLWLKPEHCNYREHLFGEPGKTTRTGDGYQARIPTSLIGVMQYKANTQEYAGNESDELDTSDKKNKLAKSDESGSIRDHASFRLGFYLFGKKLCLVKKFTKTKETGKLLDYYYGNFYITNEHKQWSIYRKKKNKKEKPGMKIFKDWRRDELFSRIFPSVSDECRASLTRATRMFEHKETSYETYAFNVRSIVGINRLVEAVGLGIKNRDLTSMTKRRSRNKNLKSPFSSLMTKEVVDLLKYGITLSKERLSDLFIEAVWPRLKAKGWHSEKPNCSRINHWVFLAPGVKKYTRRGQTKGSDYFESYVDLMLKIASVPQLLEPNLCQGMLVHQNAKQGLDSPISLKGESSKACERDADENLQTCLLTAEHQSDARVSGSQNRTKKMKITQENSPLDILAEAALADWRLMYAKSE